MTLSSQRLSADDVLEAIAADDVEMELDEDVLRPRAQQLTRRLTPEPVLRVAHEPNSERKHVRIRIPMDVVIGSMTYRVSDWSLGGFALDDVKVARRPGDRLRVQVQVPFGGFGVTLNVQAEVTWYGALSRRLGCRFVDLSASQVEMIRYLVEAHVSGRLTTLDGVLGVNQLGAPTPRKSALPAPQLTPVQQVAQVAGRAVRYSALTLAGFALLAAISLAVYQRAFTVDAVMAAVSAPLVELRAPGDGTLAGVRAVPGMHVTAGQELYRVQDTTLEGQLAVAQADGRSAAANLAALRTQYRTRGVLDTQFSALVGAEEKRAAAAHRQAQQRLEILEDQYARTQKLFDQQLINASLMDGVRLAYQDAKLAVALSESELVAAQSKRRAADEGLQLVGANVGFNDRANIAERIAVAEKDLDSAQARVDALTRQLEDLVVRSPADGVVHAALSSTGEFVKRGDIVYQVRSGSARETLVEALVTQEDASKLALGSRAEVILSDREGVLPGHVVRVNRGQDTEKRVGLPPQARNPVLNATVLVALDGEVRNVSAGLPADVKLASSGPAQVWHRLQRLLMPDAP